VPFEATLSLEERSERQLNREAAAEARGSECRRPGGRSLDTSDRSERAAGTFDV
jgi:hypothetical protein